MKTAPLSTTAPAFTAIKNDLKNLSRDPMIFLMLFLPILTTTVFVLAKTLGVDILQSELSFDARPFIPYMQFLFLMLPAFFFGFVFALIIIDEKDQGLIEFFMITPGGINTIFTVRIVLVLTASLIANYGLILVSGDSLSGGLLISAFLAAFLGPFFIIMLPTIASNKVEAMAVSKLSGLMLLAPFAGLLNSPLIRYGAMLFPSYWIGEVFFDAVYLPFGILGFLITTTAWITLFVHFFNKKIFKLS